MNWSVLQSFLVLLYTDYQLRAAFFSEPEKTAARYGLDPKTALDLAQKQQKEIEFFARSLISKRYGIIKSAIPTAERIFGKQLYELFEQYAQVHRTSGSRKYREEAWLFLYFLLKQKNLLPHQIDWLDYEAQWKRIFIDESETLFLFKKYQYPVNQPYTDIEPKNKRHFFIFFRWKEKVWISRLFSV
jgi:hypothetical protein